MKWFMAWVLLIALTWTAEAQWTNPPGVNVPGGYTSPPPSVGSLVVQMALTNILGSGVQVERVDAHTWRVTATGSAESVQADLAGHKTNETAHLSLLAGKSGTNHNHASEYYPLAGNPSNYVTASITNGLGGGTFNHTALTNLQGDVDYQHVSTARVALIDSALQAGATQGVAYAASLATYPALTDTVSKAAGALPTSGGTMTGAIDMGTYGVTGRRFGTLAGYLAAVASNSTWSAHGYSAGVQAAGEGWTALGVYAGNLAVGDNWGAFGFMAGQSAIHTNSHAIGAYAGYNARGNNRGYWDVYAAGPSYPADGATNDTVFMDSDGKLYLGGGAARAENPNAGGVLRGTWNIGTPVGSGASLTGITAGQVGAVSNTAAGIAAVGGVTNRTYVTATPLDCSPTTTITRAMIDAAPWGEMSLALTQACYLVFDPTVTSGVDVATFRIWIKGTNSLTWTAVTNMLSSGSTAAWTNATATGSWRIFDKNPDGGLRVW